MIQAARIWHTIQLAPSFKWTRALAETLDHSQNTLKSMDGRCLALLRGLGYAFFFKRQFKIRISSVEGNRLVITRRFSFFQKGGSGGLGPMQSWMTTKGGVCMCVRDSQVSSGARSGKITTLT